MVSSYSKQRIKQKFTAIWRRNPVLTEGMGLIPAIVVSNSLKNVLALSIVMAIIMIPTYLAASILKLKQSFFIRIPFYVVIASIFYIPAIIVVNSLFSLALRENIGVYLYVSVVDILVIFRADSFARLSRVSTALADAIINLIGFTSVICIAAFIRELITHGSIYGVHVINISFISAGLPLFGFILIGFMAALLKFINSRLQPKKNSKEIISDISLDIKAPII